MAEPTETTRMQACLPPHRQAAEPVRVKRVGVTPFPTAVPYSEGRVRAGESPDWTGEVVRVNREYIETRALTRFAFLEQLDGLKRVLTRKPWTTTIDYLGPETGIEVALDWRDRTVDMLLVRLQRGRLPEGYYVSEGRKCRVYLSEALTEHFGLSRAELRAMAPKGMKRPKPSDDAETAHFEEVMVHYEGILRRFARRLLDAGTSIFE